MPVSSSTEHWIKPDALTINLNHFGDPDYLQVSVLAGAVVMAFKQDVIGYNAAHNYRTWPLEAANTYLETTSAYNVYARLTRSEVNARALVVYDTVLRDIEGREITYAEDGSEVLGEANPDYFFVFLGQISASVNSNGASVLREWVKTLTVGNLDTNQQRNYTTGLLDLMFRPHYDNPLDPNEITWIEALSHIGVNGGVTMFIDNGTMSLPQLYTGLPIDGRTLIRDDNGVLMINPDIDLGGGASTWDELEGKPTWIGSTKPSYNYSEILQTPDLSVYALTKDLEKYVTLETTQTITGEKNFTGGLKVNGSPIVYDATDKYWKLEGDLLVTGGVTMFASDSSFTPSTIMDAIATDGTNLKVVNGVLTFVGSIDGGEAGSVAWDNVTGKPTFASVATSGKYSDLSGVPTLLSSFTNDLKFVSKGTTLSHYGINDAIGYSSSIIANKADAYKVAGYGTTGGGFPINGGAIKVGQNNYQMILHGRHDILRFNTVEAGTLQTWRKVWHDGNFTPSNYLLASSYTASDILAKLLTVDGEGSGLDADLLDGLQPSALSVLSASKLTNARTIWGQSFDGTENVSGNLTLDNNTSILFKDSIGNNKNVFNLNSSNQLLIGESMASSGYPTFISGNIITLRYGKSKAVGLRIDKSGRVGVNTSAPAYKLDVVGDIRSTTNVRTPIATIDGIPIYKSQDDVLYIDGNLAVRGGITMYATDAIDVPSIIDSLPIASTSAKGLASFDPNFFSVDANGNVSFIGSTGITEVKWTDVEGRPTMLSSFINDQGFASTLGELANVGSWADSAPTEGRLLYQAKDSRVWTYKNVSDFVSENGLYLPLTGGVLTGNLEVTSITHSSPYATNIDNFGNLVFGSSGLDWSIKSNDQNKIVTLYNTGKLELNGRMGSDVPLTILSSNNQGLVIRGTATETTINYNAEAYGTSWTTGINIKNELPNSYCVYSTTKNENVLKFRGSDGRGFVKFGIEFENSGLTTYATNGITIGGGDDKARYIVCYGKDHGYINIGKSPSNGNTGEISFRYLGNSSQQNMLNFGFYGGSSSEITIYYNSHTQVKGDLLTTGGITMYSDIRKKTKLADVELTLQQIADAPLIEHYYNSDSNKTTHVSSIAQYWAGLNDWFCKLDSEGFYTMEIQNAALASAISIARELVKYESKTDRKIRLLKKRISDLEDKIEQLEMK